LVFLQVLINKVPIPLIFFTVLKGSILIICAAHCPCDFINLTIFSFLIKVSNSAFVFILHVPSLSCIGPHIFMKYSWYSFPLETESTPGPYCGRKHYVNDKLYLTPLGIQPATFRVVAQCLDRLRHRALAKIAVALLTNIVLLSFK
jgi:hypothetical protein